MRAHARTPVTRCYATIHARGLYETMQPPSLRLPSVARQTYNSKVVPPLLLSLPLPSRAIKVEADGILKKGLDSIHILSHLRLLRLPLRLEKS